MFGFFKKKKVTPRDPLAAFDGVIESLERQGREVRRSAATLLALRKELEREGAGHAARQQDLQERLARAGGDDRAERTLRADLVELERSIDQTKTALARAEGDAALLLQTAETLGRKIAELKGERQSARARLSTGLVVSQALQARVDEFDRVLALDAARDEVERAHALAEVCREDARDKAQP